VRDSSPAIRTSASTQTSTDSVFSGRATQILQGKLSRSTQTFHLGREPWDDEQPRTEEYCSIEVVVTLHTSLSRQGFPVDPEHPKKYVH
jgi:hypothetical protein